MFPKSIEQIKAERWGRIREFIFFSIILVGGFYAHSELAVAVGLVGIWRAIFW